MTKVRFPYGRSFLETEIEDEYLKGILVSHLEEYVPEADEATLVKRSLSEPIGCERLSEMAKGKENIVIICSDHTRPVPSKIIIPEMLREIREGNPDAKITLLIATGFHRETTKEELIDKFGEDICRNEKIVIHHADRMEEMVPLGALPSGSELLINKIAANADLLCAEGFIEPHFFAGYSGGRKSVLPGVASMKSVMGNHCSAFIDSPYSRTGNLEGNPIHRDMLWAARKAKLAFICNVIINSKKEIVHCVSGDVEKAHLAGVDFLSEYCREKSLKTDIAISTNGGYPLDQNIYQSVKGMTAAEAAVKEDGVIVMLSKANDGHGGQSFYDTFASDKTLEELYEEFMSRDVHETVRDQWQSQIFARVLMHHQLIYVSDADDEMVRRLRMIPAYSIEEALKIAREIKGSDATITAIPDGVSLMVE